MLYLSLASSDKHEQLFSVDCDCIQHRNQYINSDIKLDDIYIYNVRMLPIVPYTIIFVWLVCIAFRKYQIVCTWTLFLRTQMFRQWLLFTYMFSAIYLSMIVYIRWRFHPCLHSFTSSRCSLWWTIAYKIENMSSVLMATWCRTNIDQKCMFPISVAVTRYVFYIALTYTCIRSNRSVVSVIG